jgi:hypothetical protein
MLKLYSRTMYCATARPSFCAGVKRICFAASIAFSVRPCGRYLTTPMFVTSPAQLEQAAEMHRLVEGVRRPRAALRFDPLELGSDEKLPCGLRDEV